jgi:hypothetical protein
MTAFDIHNEGAFPTEAYAMELEWDEIEHALKDMDEEYFRVMDDYSGRGMYGEACFAIVHDSLGDLLEFISKWPEGGFGEILQKARQDNWGHSTITYFPGVRLVGKPA